MKVLVNKTLHYYLSKYPIANKQLNIWHSEFLLLTVNNFNELKKVYGNASIVGNNRVVFNIKGNEFRLIVSINFSQQACYLIWFGTHNEYDKIDATTIPFDVDILNFNIKKR